MQLVSNSEHDVGRLNSRQAKRKRIIECLGTSLVRAPESIFGEHFQSAMLNFGVGQLKLNALESRNWLAELLPDQHIGRGELDCAVEHP